MRVRGLPALFLLAMGLAPLSASSAASAVGPAFPAPDRPVAHIVSPIWSSGPSRDAADESGQLIRLLGIRRGMAVADIGAGSGYHTVRLSPIVGPGGRVYAQDIMETYLADLRREVARRSLKNVEIVLGTEGDPGLPPKSVDRVIMVHMYHEITDPYGLLWRLVGSLRPGAQIGVIDLNRSPENHGMPPALLKCEFEAVGYRQTGFHTLKGGVGYLAIFKPPSVAERPRPEQIRACRSPGSTLAQPR